MRRAVPFSLVLGLAGCTDRLPVATLGDASTGGSSGATADEGADGTQGAPTSGPAATSGGATSGEPATTSTDGSTGSDASTGPIMGSTGAASTGAASTGDESTSGGLVPCGPPCAETWSFNGDLTLDAPASTDEFACMTGVINGDLTITGDVDAAALAGLRNLSYVPNGVSIEFNAALTDLSPFACLEQVGGLSLFDVPALTDTSGLAALKAVGGVYFHGTGVVAAPTFAPGVVVGGVRFQNNPALVDLAPMAAWTAGDWVWIEISGNAGLTNLVGVGALATSNPTFVQVRVIDNPQLASLAGLEPLTRGSVWLQDLPLVEDLAPLAGMTDASEIALFGMPKVESLAGLHNLVAVGSLIVGDCVSQQLGTPGMDGLVDLAGLGALQTVDMLALANNANMISLAGAPMLADVNYLIAVGNPMLAQATIDAFSAMLAQPPNQCVDGWDQCTCFEFLPW